MDDRVAKLQAKPERQACPRCKRKRLYYCYDCILYMEGIAELTPIVDVPVKVDIIKHVRELNSKSSAVLAPLLAPDAIRLFHASDESQLPDYKINIEQHENVVLVFPDPDATSIAAHRIKSGRPIDRLVVLDSTWHYARAIRQLPQLANLPAVLLNSYQTEYWRPQHNKPDEWLSTIEAIYYAIRETWQAEQSDDVEYDGRFDDLLFWFRFTKDTYVDARGDKAAK